MLQNRRELGDVDQQTKGLTRPTVSGDEKIRRKSSRLRTEACKKKDLCKPFTSGTGAKRPMGVERRAGNNGPMRRGDRLRSGKCKKSKLRHGRGLRLPNGLGYTLTLANYPTKGRFDEKSEHRYAWCNAIEWRYSGVWEDFASFNPRALASTGSFRGDVGIRRVGGTAYAKSDAGGKRPR